MTEKQKMDLGVEMIMKAIRESGLEQKKVLESMKQANVSLEVKIAEEHDGFEEFDV